MKKIVHQTKQAFLFSLAFYLLSMALMVLNIPFGSALFSVSLLLSLIWVILVIKEILQSPFIDHTEKLLLTLFIILLNVLAGIAYFYFLRDKVLGIKRIKK